MKTLICLLIAGVHSRQRRTSKKTYVDACEDEDFGQKPKYKVYKPGCPCEDSESCDSSSSSSDSESDCGCDEYDYYHKQKECKSCKQPMYDYCEKPKLVCYEQPKS